MIYNDEEWLYGRSGNRNGQPEGASPLAPTTSSPDTSGGVWNPGPIEMPNNADYSQWGKWGVQGLDQNKVQAGHSSPKYQIARVLSNFDSTKGITPEVLAALNQLGIGTFSGENDKLRVGGNMDPRFEGVTSSDVNIGFKTGQGQWGAWGDGAGGSAPAASPTSLAPPLTSTNPMIEQGGTSGQGGAAGQGTSSPDPFTAMGGGVQLANGDWVPKDHPLAQNAGGNTGGTNTPPAAGDTPEGKRNALWDILMQRATQGTEIDRNDPNVRREVDAYSAQEERARRNMIADTAESASPYATGAAAGVDRMTAERMGQRVGSMEASVLQRELTARRDEIQHALDAMGDTLTEQERQALQRELAVMNDSLQRAQMDTQNNQFFAGLSQSDRQFAQQLAQQGRFAELDDLYRRMALGQNQNQFLDDLGFRTTEQRNYWDWQQRQT